MGLAEPVCGLDVDFTELVRGIVEGVGWLGLQGERVLDGGDPVFESWEGEELGLGEV